jgi:single-strand DNA-binding protein
MFHTIIVVGNLGKDPELRYLSSGQAVCDFNIATSRQYTASNGQQVKETIWMRITTWGKQAETCNQYLRKGSKVLVEGRLSPDPASGGPKTYMKKDGTPGASYDITASTVRFLSSRGDDQGGAAPGGEYSAPPAADSEDGIPF